MAYEGLNQAGALGSPITVILNDNGMSISENVGALSKLFQRVRVDPTLTRVREELERGLSRLPGATELGGHIRDATKSLWFVPGALFEALGFAYIGPIDGHDIEGVRRALRTTLEMNRPVVLHVKTVKGRGYGPAEADGEAMHGATPFVIESGKAAGKKSLRPAELHRGLRARPRRRGRARPARGGHHRGDAQGHRDAAHDGPLPRADLRRRHRRAARGRLRLRPRDRRLPAGLRDLLDLPAARVRPDRPRRRHPGPPGRLRDRPRRPGRRRRPHAPRRLRPRVPARHPRPDGDGADGRARAGRHAPHGPAHRRPGRPALPARRGPRRGRSPSAPSRSRSAAAWCSSAGERVALVGYGFGASLAARGGRPGGRRASARGRPSSTPASASRSTRR